MATKYVLIPEDMYKNLIQNDKRNEIGIPSAEQAVEKAKRSRHKNASVKNLQYNQELRRYLKTRKEELEKPIKVELSNGAKGLVKNFTTEKKSLINTPQNKRFSQLSETDDGFEFDEDDFIPPSQFQFPTPKSFSALRRQIPTSRYSTRQQQKQDTPNDTRKERIISMIRENPKIYNVNEYGQILNQKGNAIKGSNINDAIDRLLNPSTLNAPSPPGTKRAEDIIKNNPEIMSIYNETPKGYNIRRRKTYYYSPIHKKGNQQGQGLINKHRSLRKNTIFKPKLWN